MDDSLTIFGLAYVVLEFIGIYSSVQAVLTARTSQGAIAWAVSLITWPIFAVPAYWVFGRSKFQGYISARRTRDLKLIGFYEDLEEDASRYRVELGQQLGDARVLEKLANLPFIRGNDARLLIDGEATFKAMFESIDRATDYVLSEFFIVKDDELGREFKNRLIAAANRGCRVFLLYDDVGEGFDETLLVGPI